MKRVEKSGYKGLDWIHLVPSGLSDGQLFVL
jgi:hypothetical protein